jgi:hypothetical protein
VSQILGAWRNWNFLEAELDIVAKLKAATQEGPDRWARIVGTRDDMERVKEDQQVTPGVYVLYRWFAVPEANEKRGVLKHRWVILIAVSAPGAKQREASPLNQVAGRFIPSVLQALHGYTPIGSTEPMVIATPPERWSGNGFGYYPLAFTSNTLFSLKQGPANAPLNR